MEESSAGSILLACTYVAVGVALLIALLVVLSVMPDCRAHWTHDMLTVISIQFAVVLVLLFVNTVALSYVLAAETDVFVDVSVTDSPGYLAVFCLTAIAFLQLYLSARRMIEYTFPSYSKKFPIRSICFVVLLSAFLLAAKRFMNIVFDKRSLNYKMEGQRWLYSQPSASENFHVAAGVGFALALLGVLYAGCAVLVCMRCARASVPCSEKRALHRDLVWLAVCVGADLSFGALLLHAHFAAVPPAHRPQQPLQPRFGAGLVQSFVLPVWPVFMTLICDDRLREALRYRTGIFVTGTPPMSPTAPRRSLVRPSRLNSLPIYMHASMEKRGSN